MKTPEARLKDEIKTLLKRMGAHYYMPVPSGYGKQTLDFLCCVKGRFVGIETKAPGKKPTPRQQQCIDEINAAGGLAFWCDHYEDAYFMLGMLQ